MVASDFLMELSTETIEILKANKDIKFSTIASVVRYRDYRVVLWNEKIFFSLANVHNSINMDLDPLNH